MRHVIVITLVALKLIILTIDVVSQKAVRIFWLSSIVVAVAARRPTGIRCRHLEKASGRISDKIGRLTVVTVVGVGESGVKRWSERKPGVYSLHQLRQDQCVRLLTCPIQRSSKQEIHLEWRICGRFHLCLRLWQHDARGKGAAPPAPSPAPLSHLAVFSSYIISLKSPDLSQSEPSEMVA